MLISEAESRDERAIAAIILPVISEGATYSLDPKLSETDALAYWMGADKETYVAEQDDDRFRARGSGRETTEIGVLRMADLGVDTQMMGF